ncbi:uncharacterized protein L201_003948 [Kwoniella dendrophila CBS 6074]|uniref:CCZ1/INTU/HSP4 first Longin domain-containing protein n=1 Tax=Kwoniella dendrophila CBS 6074 TaxID=1295534 RepID=A0AAX4JWV6_9TREE
MPQKSASPGPSRILPANLSHFVIFNPTIKADLPKSDDKDNDDDLREAAQILFYTSREAGGVSRDKMLRQVGLAKGLMGFGNMITESSSKYTSIHGNRSRMIIYEPEPNFFIYICITLSHIDNEKKDSVSGSQGISDEMLVDGLAKGYEDFRLLHGPLSSQTIPSATLSSTLDKYFTRFAFQFESTYLGSPTLSDWIHGYPASNISENMFEEYKVNLDGSLFIIGPKGPLYTDDTIHDQSLIGYLHDLVKLTLPPPPQVSNQLTSSTIKDKHSLGFGLNLELGRKSPHIATQNQSIRKSSWTNLGGWVPDLTRTATPPPSTKKIESPKPLKSILTDEGKTSNAKWNLGLGGITDAMGNMGNVLGLGKSSTPEMGQGDKQVQKDHSSPRPSRSNDITTQTTSAADNHIAYTSEQPSDVISELEAAAEPDEDIEWEGKYFWVKSKGSESYEKRRACWVIRNNILISIVLPANATPPWSLPTTKETTALFAKLTDNLNKADVHHHRSVSPNPTLAVIGKTQTAKKGNFNEIDAQSDQSLIHLKSNLEQDHYVHEIMAKTSSITSRFLIAKKDDMGELYMKINSDDASLTDADHAVRSFTKLNHIAIP